jgi:hypothetical protein
MSASHELPPSSASSATANDGDKNFRDPVAEAKTLAEFYAQSSCECFESSGGFNDRRYEFLARCYPLAIIFSNSPSDFQRFKNDAFWKGFERKPYSDDVVRWVLYFAMRATSDQVRNRACKAAKVLNSFLDEEVRPEDVFRRLKEGRGPEPMYNRIRASASKDQFAGDNLERGLAEIRSLLEDESGSTRNDDLDAPDYEPAEPSAMALTGNLEPVDRPPLSSLARVHALQRQSYDEEIQQAGGAKVGPLNRIDRKTQFVIDMTEDELANLLGAKRGTINFTLDPPDRRDWRRAVVRSYRLFCDQEGPWPNIYADTPSPGKDGLRDGGEPNSRGQAPACTRSPSELAIESAAPVGAVRPEPEQYRAHASAAPSQPLRAPPSSKSKQEAAHYQATAHRFPIPKSNRAEVGRPSPSKPEPAKGVPHGRPKRAKKVTHKRKELKRYEPKRIEFKRYEPKRIELKQFEPTPAAPMTIDPRVQTRLPARPSAFSVDEKVQS